MLTGRPLANSTTSITVRLSGMWRRERAYAASSASTVVTRVETPARYRLLTNGCSRVELKRALKLENVTFGQRSDGPAFASIDVKSSQISGAKKATPSAASTRLQARPPIDARG